uniref:hypothetical protein n=1 Tax=[Lactobacillus] rogosae TaxID=706562 RepID=UPI003FEFAB41
MGIFGGFFRKVGSVIASGAKAVGSAMVSGAKVVANGVKKVAARVSGKDKYEEAERLYEEISKRYNEKWEHFQKEIERITALIEEHVKSINDSKRMIKRELFPAMANKISKIKDIRISDEYSVEEYIESVLNVDSIRSREQLFTIDFNAHKVKTTFQAIFTLGFYTRKKANETLENVKEEETKINSEISRMDSELNKINIIEKSIKQVADMFTSVIEMYNNLLIRLDSSINYLLVRSLAFAHQIIGKQMSVKILPKMQQKEVEAIVTASKILKTMTETQLLSVEKQKDVQEYDGKISGNKKEFESIYKAA